METKMQLKHPAGKKAIRMDTAKYDVLKNTLMKQLKAKGELTHEEMYRAIAADFKKNNIAFEGSVEWHMEWVKLDLEAKKEIKRIPGTSPTKFTIGK